MARNGRVILSKNINLEKDYKNVLNYSETNMLNLCLANKVYENNTYSFIKPGLNEIEVGATYDTCIQANYIAFQNTSYSNKWFFAFIDEVEYRSESSSRIKFTVDVFSTWFSYWTGKTCFTIREHVNDDTIGLHTIPEQLETGEYINNSIVNYGLGAAHPVVACTYEVLGTSTGTKNYTYNGIPSGLIYYLIGDNTSVSAIKYIIDALENAGRLDALVSIFIVPDLLTGYSSISWDYAETSGGLSYGSYKKIPWSTSASNMGTFSVAKNITTIDGYTPKNNKLFTFPYNYLVVDNNGGSSYIYPYEYFSNEQATFQLYGDITPGCSIRCIPLDYKGSSGLNNSEGINAIKYPIGSWSGDVYTNWLTQNSVNIATSLASTGLQIIGGLGLMATGGGAIAGASTLANGALSIASTLGQVYQHSLIPPQVEGNINSGDVTYSIGKSDFTFYKKSIKSEYAKMIDDYFTRFGYKINELKIPNLTGRTYYNFVQIGEGESIGNSTGDISIPSSHMDIINKIFQSGVTIWHNHANINDYSLNNTIVQ